MQHAGSDENVWKDVARRDRFKKMKAATSYKSLPGRTGDVLATLDQLGKVILALSSEFWDAFRNDDQAAKQWLNSDSAKKVLEPMINGSESTSR